jgi:uncharacterized protein DUF3775
LPTAPEKNMTKPTAKQPMNEPDQVLTIPIDTVRFIIGKLHEYDSKDMLAEPEEETNPLECEDVDRLSEQKNDYQFDSVLQELHSFIHDLPEDQQVDLVALMWLGRDNCSADDWSVIREEAAEAHNTQTARYLLGTSMASDFLEDGLSTLGLSDEGQNSEQP